MRTYELAERLGGTLEYAADEIRAKSADPAVRRRALLWKADGIPAIYAAAFRPDPLAGTLDLWVLLEQSKLYFTEGAGKAAFGSEQPIALEAIGKMFALSEETAAVLTRNPESLARWHADVEKFARAHPVEGTFSGRATAAGELARFYDAESLSAFAAVGQATETVSDVSLRLGSYSTLLPKEIRWQGELLAGEVLGRENLRATLEDVDRIGEVARRADGLLADLPGAARAASGPIEELVEEQRTALLADIDRQRQALAAFISAERQTMLDAIGEERRAAFESVARERAAALQEIDAISKRSVENAALRARGVVDDVFWRVLILLAASAILAVAAFRVVRGPRR
jgi:hypothetical protein